jgi:hypothetical protein
MATDLYLMALRRHVDALADPPPGPDKREQAHYLWMHWYAAQRLARAPGMEVVERELARQGAEGRSP